MTPFEFVKRQPCKRCVVCGCKLGHSFSPARLHSSGWMCGTHWREATKGKVKRVR